MVGSLKSVYCVIRLPTLDPNISEYPEKFLNFPHAVGFPSKTPMNRMPSAVASGGSQPLHMQPVHSGPVISSSLNLPNTLPPGMKLLVKK